MLLSECRLSQEDKLALDELYQSRTFTAKHVHTLRQLAMVAPPPPSAVQQAILAAQTLASEDHAIESKRPPWLAPVCKSREALVDGALLLTSDGVVHAFKLVYATLSPYLVAFSPLLEVEHYLDASAVGSDNWEDLALSTLAIPLQRRLQHLYGSHRA